MVDLRVARTVSTAVVVNCVGVWGVGISGRNYPPYLYIQMRKTWNLYSEPQDSTHLEPL